MNRKLITVEFVVPTVFAVALAIMHSIGAVYLTEMYLAPFDQVEAHCFVGRQPLAHRAWVTLQRNTLLISSLQGLWDLSPLRG